MKITLKKEVEAMLGLKYPKNIPLNCSPYKDKFAVEHPRSKGLYILVDESNVKSKN